MVTGTAKVVLLLHGNRTLKGKRQVIRSVKERLKGRFNAAVAEVEDHDLHQRGVLGVAVVAADAPHADSQLQTILDAVAQMADVGEVAVELTHH